MLLTTMPVGSMRRIFARAFLPLAMRSMACACFFFELPEKAPRTTNRITTVTMIGMAMDSRMVVFTV